MDAPKHVILSSYDPKSKKHERYDALVIGSRELPEHTHPVLNLVHFRHDDLAAHHALSGVDWADTIDRTLDVPHKDDLQNQSFYWTESEAEQLKVQHEKAIADMNAGIAILRGQLKDKTEEVEHLKGLPSGGDLDAAAADAAAKELTEKPTLVKGKAKKE